ncbi:lysophospholipid acyltransferase family protein [uncultured Jatrophihabitans sp.]|uniref:lysophospholipid acyltransferase family protein n=1 Tax=uncultured Jatrophihabitans sp. TaxID=1610747 RepID=UPI0035CA0E03
MKPRRVAPVYRIVMWIATPFVKWWGRLEVTGAELLDRPGPAVLFSNHDSHWDPLIGGLAAPRRQIRALAKSSLWGNPIVSWVLDHMGQIPIERGRGDAAALSRAIEELEAGACIGVYPEGTISRGRQMRALSGAGRLALAVPSAHVVGLRVVGAVDIVRFPRRPRIRAQFFEPAGGQPQEGESAAALTKRVMVEVRAGAPFALAGRNPQPVDPAAAERSA